MIYTTLIDGESLTRNLGAGWCIFDCRFHLSDPQAGERAYMAGHIPGAHYLHLDRDLAGPRTASSGRHPLPEPNGLVTKLRAAGVSNSSQVIAYDATTSEFAARLWWLLRWLGHPQVAVLDGGWNQWFKQGRSVSRGAPAAATPGDFHAKPDDSLWLSSAAVWELSRTNTGCLLDARASSRFRGEEEPIDPVAGHVPGAVNLPYAGNVADDGRFKSAETLRTRFLTVLDDVKPGEVACMCGSGVTACHNLLAMEVAGLRGAKLYAGSWSEWIQEPSRPVARGPT